MLHPFAGGRKGKKERRRMERDSLQGS